MGRLQAILGGWHRGDNELNDVSSEVASLCRLAVDEYISSAAEINKNVPGARSRLASLQTMRLQEILKEVASMSLSSKSRAGLIQRLTD